MNGYDFDGTIYDGDSTIDFYFYCLGRNVKIIKFLPKQIKGVILYLLKRIDKNEMKEYFYTFLLGMENIEIEVERFWINKQNKIKDWYIKQRKSDDVIISASPQFLLSPVCEKLGIHNLIASNINHKTGKCQGKNCRGEEKVIRFKSEFLGEEIEEFYSDSYTDLPMARIAKEAFLVNKNKIEKWTKM